MSDQPASAVQPADEPSSTSGSANGSPPLAGSPAAAVAELADSGAVDAAADACEPLPPRAPLAAPKFLAPLALGALGAVSGGLLLCVLTGVMYLPCIWDGILGAMVGAACIYAIQAGRWTGGWSAFLWSGGCVLAAYVVFAVAYYIAWASQFPQLPWSFTAIQVMVENKAKNFALPGPIPVGPIGLAVAAGCQIGLAWYIAAKGAGQAVRWNLSRTVPPEALALVSRWKREGYKDHHLRDALARRGWTDAGDQTQALRAAEAAARLGR